ncbi:subunits of heterodimeric actin filament capping protein Capz superfamily isoform X2 [Wolffia australiana]
MAGSVEQAPELGTEQKKEIAQWFLSNAPAGEIQYVAKDVRSILQDDQAYEAAAASAFPEYNKARLISLKMPDGSGDVIISQFAEIDSDSYLDPRTTQVATVDHIKQACTKLRPATDEELPSSYIEAFRASLDAEICKYADETYSRGNCAVYCTRGKEVEGPGASFELTVVISADRQSPQNFWYFGKLHRFGILTIVIYVSNGSWRSIWTVEFKDDLQIVDLRGKLQVDAHYFEEGNVQLDTNHECKDSTIFQSPEDSAVAVTSIIRHHETEYMGSLEISYFHLPDTTFKDLRRKLPVTRTLFPWRSASQFSLTREIAKELNLDKK